MMEDLDDSNVESRASEAANLAISKKLSAVKILEDLGPYLTDVNLGKRKIGVNFLSIFLSNLSEDFLNEDECRLFAKFYQDRINDHHSLIPSIIKGMEAIFSFVYLKSEDLCSLFRIFFSQVHTQSQIVSDRRQIFQIFEQLLRFKMKHILPLGSEFVLSFIQAVDAEKDPINMNLIFSLWPLVLKEFSLDPFEEDVFEAMSCYFPIDFSPPRGGSLEITKEDLVLGLRNCLSASELFAPLAMPLFIEKLDSDLQDAKIDANLTMIACIRKYSPEQLKPHLADLWELLKKEILGIKMNVNDDVINTCHKVIHEVTLTLANAIQTIENRQIFEENWLNLIWQDIGRHLKDIELKFMSLSVDILVDVISTSKSYPSAFMLDKSMPILLQLCNLHERKKPSILDFMSRLLKGSADRGKSSPIWYDNFLHVCFEALNTCSGQFAAKALVSGIHFLEKTDAEKIFDAIITSNHHDLIYSCIKQCHGTRPTDKDFETLYNLEKGDTLANIYKDFKTFEGDLDRILAFLNKEFGLNMVRKVIKHHETLNKEILEKILKTTITLAPDCDTKFELLSELSPKLGPDFGPIVMEILSVNKNSFQLQKSLIGYADTELINSLKVEFLAEIMALENNDELLGHIKASIVNKIQNPDLVLNNNETEVQWIAKGLLFRMVTYAKSKIWIEKLLKCLADGNEEINFEILVRPLEPFLVCKETKAALSRQKIFILTKPALVKAFQENHQHSALHLKALICQLPYVPKFALSNEISSILPLLIQGLGQNASKSGEEQGDRNSLGEETLCLTSLTCLKDLIQHEPTKFAPFLSTVMPIWLKISKDKNRSMKTRIKALECIKSATNAETKDLVPMKKDVINGLVPALDDHKRLVRQAATSARNSWSIST